MKRSIASKSLGRVLEDLSPKSRFTQYFPEADGRLTMDSYADTGGWEKGLEQHLEVVYTNLSAPQRTVSARVFRQLSELDKGRAVRRQADMAELIEVCGQEAVEVVAKFRAEGFITSQTNPVDITHECILREWPRLRGWLEQEDRNARRLHQLAEAAKDANWQSGLMTRKQGEPVQALAGLTLQNLVSWRDDTRPTAAWARRYMDTVDYETASDCLTWSEMREKHALWRTRALFALLGLLLLGLALASLVFYRAQLETAKAVAAKKLAEASAIEAQKKLGEASATEAQALKEAADETAAAAQRTPRESRARELAASSTESLSDDPEKSILLAVQALNATLRFGQPPVLAAQEALHQAILSSQVRKTLRGHADSVYGVAFSPDGKRLATASGTTVQVHVLDLRTD